MGSISVVYNQDLSTLAVPDGVVIDVKTPPASGALTPAQVSAVAYVGTAQWGPYDAVSFISDPLTLLKTYGAQTVAPTDLCTFANLALQLGVTDIRIVRVGDGTQTAGVLPLLGATAAFVNLVGKFPGSLVNGATATLTYSPLTPAAQMQTSGNAGKVFVDLSIFYPNGDSEIYQNLDGNVATTVGNVTTYAITPAQLALAVISAVNTGIPNGRGVSQYFVASASTAPTPGAPVVGTPNTVATLGTDGATFANGAPKTLDQAQLGSLSVSPATGMYALGKNVSGAALSLCGNTDVSTIAGPMLAFCKSQNGHAVVSFPANTPTGTSTSSSISLKNLYGVADYGITPFDGNFVEIIDSVNGAIHRWVDPSPLACARFAVTAINISPANLSMNGVIVGTARVGSLMNSPYGDTEALQLENAGINFFSNDTSGNVGFAIRHNKNSLGKTAGYRGNIAYSRIVQFLVASYQSPLLGQLVGQDQGFSKPDDVVRASARILFETFLGDLSNDGIIDTFSVVCDLSNNKPGLGQLRVDTIVNQNEIVDVIGVGLVTGVGLAVSVVNQT